MKPIFNNAIVAASLSHLIAVNTTCGLAATMLKINLSVTKISSATLFYLVDPKSSPHPLKQRKYRAYRINVKTTFGLAAAIWHLVANRGIHAQLKVFPDKKLLTALVFSCQTPKIPILSLERRRYLNTISRV
jgi:hypothetical protein